MNSQDPDFYSALMAYADSGKVQLHMPGHKGGRGFMAPELAAIGRLDYTELPGLDDWHRPNGVLQIAQQQLADAYGAQVSYYLVNGATSGIHALLMSLGTEAKVLLPRHSHRAFLGGMVLAGTIPSYIAPRLDERWGLPLATDPRDVEPLTADPLLKALFVTSPSYFGTCSQNEVLISLAHRAGILALFDEAHGAHFGFHPSYPLGALQQGADGVVQGMHKTLPAMTGVGSLHLAGVNIAWQQQVKQALDILITTSPSQPLLASADWARAWVSSPAGLAGLDAMCSCSKQFDHSLEQIPGLERIRVPGGEPYNDPGRVAIGIDKLKLTGWQIEHLLAEEYGIQIEMAGANYLVALFTPFNTKAEWQSLAAALNLIAERYLGEAVGVQVELPPHPRIVLSPREAYFAPRHRVKLAEASGLISAEIVAAYPPGIPCLLPGEDISSEMVEYLQYLAQSDGRIQGMLDPKSQYIYVIDRKI